MLTGNVQMQVVQNGYGADDPVKAVTSLEKKEAAKVYKNID